MTALARHRHCHQGVPPTGQGGAALITSLIFITVLTILGLSALGTALLEARMAGNARDRGLAWQAAEAALRDAELYIRNSGRIVGMAEEDHDAGGCNPAGLAADQCAAQSCVNGLCYNGGTMKANATDWGVDPVYEDDDMWDNALLYSDGDTANGKQSGGNDLVVNDATGNCNAIPGDCNYQEPDLIPLVRQQPQYLIESFEKAVGGTSVYYRITVRGFGMRPGTQVMLQSVFDAK